jgi:hypothetical protein
MSTLMDLISKLDEEPKNFELVFQIADAIESKYLYDFNTIADNCDFYGYLIQDFINAVYDKQNISHYVYELLRIYGVYLRDGIALIPFTKNKESLELIENWCLILSISYNKVKVDRYVESYCLTHKEIVPEDDHCPYKI